MKLALNVDAPALMRFLLAANAAGYAGGDARTWTRQPDGSTTISFTDGRWRMDDNFFGGEPYGGREVVFCEDRAVWMLVYYGCVAAGADADVAYGQLREAMSAMPAEYPYRGPKRFEGAGFVYTNEWDGDFSNIRGEEEIHRGPDLVYRAYYAGGLVDRRAGD